MNLKGETMTSENITPKIITAYRLYGQLNNLHTKEERDILGYSQFISLSDHQKELAEETKQRNFVVDRLEKEIRDLKENHKNELEKLKGKLTDCIVNCINLNEEESSLLAMDVSEIIDAQLKDAERR